MMPRRIGKVSAFAKAAGVANNPDIEGRRRIASYKAKMARDG